MNRREVELQGYIERYIAGRLRGGEREAFEVFWFGSDEGFESLRDGIRIRAGFSEEDHPVEAADSPGQP